MNDKLNQRKLSPLKTATLCALSILCLGLLIPASPASAEYRLEVRTGDETRAAATPGPAYVTEALETPGFTFYIPYYVVNLASPTSTTTLLSVRNESLAPTTVEVSYYPTDSNVPFVSRFIALQGKEIYTANFRDQLGGEPGVPNGVVEGWVRVTADAALSVDHFIVTPDEAFATGDTAVALDELCAAYKVRYLIGGGFSGGTQVTIFTLSPQGTNVGSDPATAEIEAYDEDGNSLSEVALFTDGIVTRLSASDLTPPGQPFGALEVRFLNDSSGFVAVTHDASGLYSAGLKGYCLQFLAAAANNPQ